MAAPADSPRAAGRADRFGRRLLLASLLGAWPSAARAQAEEPGAARLPEEARAPLLEVKLSTRTATTAPCPPPAGLAYEEGFQRLARGDRMGAASQLRRAQELCPRHPFAAELLRLATAQINGAGVLRRDRPPDRPRLVEPPPLPAPAAGEEAPLLLSRGELVSVQTLNGMVEGLLFCAMLECQNGQVAVGSAFLGAGVGFTLSFVLSDAVRPGQALAINSGMGWGYWNGIAYSLAADLKEKSVPGTVLSFSLAGTGAGVVIAALMKPKSGDVSLANSAGLWAGVLTTWILVATDSELFEGSSTLGHIVATNAGLLAGVGAARLLDYSRGHVLLIDAGGLLGLLLGVGGSFLIDESPAAGLLGGLAFAGTLGGLGLVSFLTRDVDEPAAPDVALLPVGPAGTRGLSLVGRF